MSATALCLTSRDPVNALDGYCGCCWRTSKNPVRLAVYRWWTHGGADSNDLCTGCAVSWLGIADEDDSLRPARIDRVFPGSGALAWARSQVGKPYRGFEAYDPAWTPPSARGDVTGDTVLRSGS